MNFAGSTIWLAEAGPGPGHIIGGLLFLVAVAFTALMTGRAGRQRRRPAGTPIYRRTSSYSRHRRKIDDSGPGDSGDVSDSGSSSDSGSGCGSGCGGGCGGGGGS